MNDPIICIDVQHGFMPPNGELLQVTKIPLDYLEPAAVAEALKNDGYKLDIGFHLDNPDFWHPHALVWHS